MKLLAAAAVFVLARFACAASSLDLVAPDDPAALILADHGGGAAIVIDRRDYPVVLLAAELCADDIARVSGRRPPVATDATAPEVVIAGTLGHSALVDLLVGEGKLPRAATIRGQWEATLWEVIEQPLPGVKRALVIVGSDRRATAYGLMQLSEAIGVSPWYWWADVPVAHRNALAIALRGAQTDSPAVKYRGIFINDEDWGLNPWASKTFDPDFGNIGPKTYAKVFELMLRLRLNTLWPAMHACTAEFASQPENLILADEYGIVAGSSHCEPMLCNNVHWNEDSRGKWDYALNSAALRAYWKQSAETRGSNEAVWTLGIRGIHDAGMEGPKDVPTRIGIVSRVIQDQRALLDRCVTKGWGPVAECFVPYKEVLAVYDAGLKVPDDVTLVWTDDNFGYIRRLSAPVERRRSGGAGVYWHLSYYGGPHSYTWIDTTPPAFIWEELHKAWANDARRLWVMNVGDIKPMEIGISYFAQLAWNADKTGPESQTPFLRAFATAGFGGNLAPAIAGLLGDFYRLGTIRKPELMDREWALTLASEEAVRLESEYAALLARAGTIAGEVAPDARDAYTETVGFPARVLGLTGLIFMADRAVQLGVDVQGNQQKIARLRVELESDVTHFNTGLAAGKWNHMMPGLVTGKELTAWSSQVRWPWGQDSSGSRSTGRGDPVALRWRDAASADRYTQAAAAQWISVAGLGASGRALALEPAELAASWKPGDPAAPALDYVFAARGGDAVARIEFLPTFRLCPGMRLRVAVAVDNRPAEVVEVPGSSGQEDERGSIRQAAVQSNSVRVILPLSDLSAGAHTFRIIAVDPGIVLDRVSLP